MSFGGRSELDGRNRLVLPLIILAGVVLGGYLGELLNMLANAVEWLSFLKWLNYGFDFGLSSPFTLDLGILTVSFGITIKFTVCGIIGIIAGVIIGRRL